MKRFRVLRYIAYTIEIIVFFIIQQTPGLIPSVYGILPTLLIPIACSIAMFEGPVCSLFYGVFSGFLLDYGTNCTFGFHALILGLICFIISFLVQDVFHNNFLTGLINCQLWYWQTPFAVCCRTCSPIMCVLKRKVIIMAFWSIRNTRVPQTSEGRKCLPYCCLVIMQIFSVGDESNLCSELPNIDQI